MIKILQIIFLVFFSLLMISASCDKGTEGCTDANACNYNKDAAIDDNSCWFANTGCDCSDPPDSIVDCLEICDVDISNDPPDSDGDGNCDDGVIGGCLDSLMCNYNPNAYNDGSCAVDLSQLGGLVDGTDCNEYCGGMAVMDECDLCVGGLTNLGQSWRIKIISVATFKLQDGTSMGTDTNTVTLGTSIYALDGYNGEEFNDIDPDDENNYIDIAEPPLTLIDADRNNIRFYFPHDDNDDWDEWGSLINSDFIPTLQFDSDIRSNDYHSLFTEEKGLNWFAVIEPTLIDTFIIDGTETVIQYESIMDSIKLQITHLEGIKCSHFKIALDREKGKVISDYDHVVENNQLGLSVHSDKAITLTINISNICIQEFDESCPDE